MSRLNKDTVSTVEDTHKQTQTDDPNIKRKNGLLYLSNLRQLRVNGKDILPDLLRIIKENPKP